MQEEDLKKKHKVLKVILIVLIVFFLIYILGYSLYRKRISGVVKEIVEQLGCTFYSTNISNEEGFDIDINIAIPYKPVENSGVSNQYWYETLIKATASKLGDKAYRLIDKEQNVIIRAKCEKKVVQYTINGMKKYFDTELAHNNKIKKQEQKNIDLIVRSKELVNLINNEWNRAKSKALLGTTEKTLEDYDCYIDEGYYVKSINLKVINIVFNKNYNQEIFEGIKTGMSNNVIREKLGYPAFISNSEIEINGYKTEKYYVFFSNGEISIYPIQEFEELKNSKFAEITTNLINSGDIDSYIKNLTEIYPNYDEYYKNQNELSIKYSFLGLKIEVDQRKNYRFIIYNNYQGKIIRDVSIDDIENGQDLPPNMIIDRYDAIFDTELKRPRFI